MNAYRYLADSNLDWEDHGYYIEEFQRRHPEMSITIEPARGKPVPGWILVGANGLVGIFEPERFRWLREGFVPVREVDVLVSSVLHPSRARADVAGERAPRSGRVARAVSLVSAAAVGRRSPAPPGRRAHPR